MKHNLNFKINESYMVTQDIQKYLQEKFQETMPFLCIMFADIFIYPFSFNAVVYWMDIAQ